MIDSSTYFEDGTAAMKIACKRDEFMTAFQTVAAVAPQRSPKEILQHVKLTASDDGVVLMATDLEIGIRHIATGIEVERAGAIVLPVARMSSILRESQDDVLTLDANEKQVLVRGERSEFRLPLADASEFQDIPELDDTPTIEIPAKRFREIVRRTIFATDSDSSRYALGGVLVEMSDETLTVVGTDGRRLAVVESPIAAGAGLSASEGNTIIPARAMQLIERSLSDNDADIRIAIKGSDFVVVSPRMTLYARLLEGRFPTWRNVIPDTSSGFDVDIPVGPLHSAVKQAEIATSDESRSVDFAFAKGKLTLSGQAAGIGESRIDLPIAYEGDDVTVKLNPQFVKEFLRVLDAETNVGIHLTDGDSAVLCRSDVGFSYVIMPLAK